MRKEIGYFRDYVELRRLTAEDDCFQWTKLRDSYAQAKRQKGISVFASLGFGAEKWTFLLRLQDFDVEDLIYWRGETYLPTYVDREEPGFLLVEAAKVPLKQCSQGVCSFPAVLTERYVSHTDDVSPYAANVIDYILVTPKRVALDVGGIVNVDGTDYAVRALHALDPHKQQYEIRRVVDL